jgi:carbon-monoxide dehydrogenase small subunit
MLPHPHIEGAWRACCWPGSWPHSGRNDLTDHCSVRFNLNGEPVSGNFQSNRVLADVLRETFALRSVKISCDQGVCGACTVLVDGSPHAACMTFAFEAEGRTVTTIDGLEANQARRTQRAFAEASAFQCGFCTTGMILLAHALLDHNPAPSRHEIVRWMSANICRCTGYQTIVEAVASISKADTRTLA